MDRYHMVNGELVKYTPEELEALNAIPDPEVSPSLDERVSVLEQDMADIQTAYQEGVNNA